MKNIILGFCLFMIGILSLLSILMLESKSIRKKEIQTGMAQSMEKSVEKNAYTMKNFKNEVDNTNTIEQANRLFIADLVESMVIHLQSDSNVSVDVMQLNAEKGAMSLKINEQFQNVFGKSSEITNQRTVIFNQNVQEEEKTYTLNFYLSKEDLIEKKNVYKSYVIMEQKAMISPKIPTEEGKKFSSWVDANDYEADFSQTVLHDMDYYASWESLN